MPLSTNDAKKHIIPVKNDWNSVFIPKVRSLNKKTNFAPEIRHETISLGPQDPKNVLSPQSIVLSQRIV